jgi:hypothetical protein
MSPTGMAFYLLPGVDVMIAIFCDFLQVSSKKLVHFLKTNQKTPFFRQILIIIASVPRAGHRNLGQGGSLKKRIDLKNVGGEERQEDDDEGEDEADILNSGEQKSEAGS